MDARVEALLLEAGLLAVTKCFMLAASATLTQPDDDRSGPLLGRAENLDAINRTEDGCFYCSRALQ